MLGRGASPVGRCLLVRAIRLCHSPHRRYQPCRQLVFHLSYLYTSAGGTYILGVVAPTPTFMYHFEVPGALLTLYKYFP